MTSCELGPFGFARSRFDLPVKQLVLSAANTNGRTGQENEVNAVYPDRGQSVYTLGRGTDSDGPAISGVDGSGN